MSSRRKYSPEFKAEAIELLISSGRPMVQVAAEIGVNEGTLGNWGRVGKEEHADAAEDEPGPAEWAKFKVFQAENAEPLLVADKAPSTAPLSQALALIDRIVRRYIDDVRPGNAA